MNEHFLNYEQSLAVKELGFDERCLGFYDETDKTFTMVRCNNSDSWLNGKHCSTPLKSQFFKWVRDKYGLYSHIFSKGDGAFVWCIRWYEDGEQKDIPYELVYTYEQAENACINKIIELIKG